MVVVVAGIKGTGINTVMGFAFPKMCYLCLMTKTTTCKAKTTQTFLSTYETIFS